MPELLPEHIPDIHQNLRNSFWMRFVTIKVESTIILVLYNHSGKPLGFIGKRLLDQSSIL
jgi:hypothetical protein